MVDGIEHLENPPAEYLDPQNIRNAYGHLDGFRQLTAEECPAPTKWGVRYKSVAVNSPVYCAWLLRQFILKGGQVREYTLGDVMEAFYLAENVKTVINCSGMGFGDPKSFIIRGVYQPSIHPSIHSFIYWRQSPSRHVVSQISRKSQLTKRTRPNMSRPQPMHNDTHAPKHRRQLVILHSASTRRRHHHRRHKAATRLGSEPVPPNARNAAVERREVVPVYARERRQV